jgi:hypothetical protein
VGVYAAARRSSGAKTGEVVETPPGRWGLLQESAHRESERDYADGRQKHEKQDRH